MKSMWWRAVVGLTVAAAGLLGAFAQAQAAPFVYVANSAVPAGGDVSQYDVGVGGLLAPLIPATVPAGTFPLGITVSPDGRSVYVANADDDTVSQYNVAGSGALAPKSPGTVPAGDAPSAVTVSPDGRSAYVANTISRDVSQYDVGTDGALTPKSPAAIPAGFDPFGITVSPDGGSVYVDNARSNTVSQYDVGTGGLLTPKSPPEVPTGTSPVKIAVSPDGASVYVTNAEAPGAGIGTVSQYDVGAGGLLTPKSPPKVATGLGPGGVAISPDGRSVYVANNFSGTVSQYDVGTDGALTPKSPPTVGAGAPFGVAVSADGESVYVTTAGATDFGTVSQFDVGAGGALTPKSPATVMAGFGAGAVAVSPAVNRPIPTSIKQCKHGGWRQFGFKNQGQCLVFVINTKVCKFLERFGHKPKFCPARLPNR